jgi:ADP-ribose pyrophosphatase YjhB (NUDIX family)
MKNSQISCPNCGAGILLHRNPAPVVDILISYEGGIVLIERKFEPFGWAIPGGFVDYGETVEQAAIREALEETSLDVRLTGLIGVYSDPSRDPRQHTISTLFAAEGRGRLWAADDAKRAGVYTIPDLPSPLVFDHGKMISDYLTWKKR